MTSTSDLHPRRTARRRTAELLRGGLRLDLRSRPSRMTFGIPDGRSSHLIALPRRAPFTVHLVLPDGRELHRRAISLHVAAHGRDAPTHVRLVMTSMDPADMVAALAVDALALGISPVALAPVIEDLSRDADPAVRTRTLPAPVEPIGLIEVSGSVRAPRDGASARSNVSWGLDLRTLVP